MPLMAHVPVKKHRTNVHVAFLLSRGKLVALATNMVGSRSRGCGYSARTIHAERAVIKKAGDLGLLRGASLIVIRVRDDGSVACSKPCRECSVHLTKCIREHGLRTVYYSAGDRPLGPSGH